MTTTKVRTDDPKKDEVKHTRRDNWEVMKPFVRFSFTAVKVIGLALIAVVSVLPLLKPRHGGTEIKHR
jgi:hypothetical protein